jgi:hypothetical protein
MLCDLSHQGESVPLPANRRGTMRKVAHKTQEARDVYAGLSTGHFSSRRRSDAVDGGKPPEVLGKWLFCRL